MPSPQHVEPSAWVDRSAWLAPAGRRDAIDEIADEFERRAPAAPVSRDAERDSRWPLRSRGWRSLATLHQRSADSRLH